MPSPKDDQAHRCAARHEEFALLVVLAGSLMLIDGGRMASTSSMMKYEKENETVTESGIQPDTGSDSELLAG